MKLTDTDFQTIIKLTPLISIDFIIYNENGEIMLGKRKNEPAKGYWFTPGGRIFKRETIQTAMVRILLQETGISLNHIHNYQIHNICDHFYENNFYDNTTDTHYLNISINTNYMITNDNINMLNLDQQHSDILWLSVEQLLKHNDVHLNVKNQFKCDLFDLL